jgi:hypothetical protein
MIVPLMLPGSCCVSGFEVCGKAEQGQRRSATVSPKCMERDFGFSGVPAKCCNEKPYGSTPLYTMRHPHGPGIPASNVEPLSPRQLNRSGGDLLDVNDAST